MSDMTSALGAPVRYGVSAGQAKCVYNVVATRRSDNVTVATQLIVTDIQGNATALFTALPLGNYLISATSPNCPGCAPPSRSVDVVIGGVNTCNPCCAPGSGGGTGACNGVVGINPTTFNSGVETFVDYTLTGVANCRVKLLAFNGNSPMVNPDTGFPIFTYVTNGVPNRQTNTWGTAFIGATISWRVAPMGEQDACLQGCTITPQVIPLTIVAGTPCAVGWNINPQDPVTGLAIAGYFSASGLPPSCSLKVQSFAEDGITPVLSAGAPVYVNISASGVPYDTLGAIAGASGWWKPAPIGLQSACLQGCTILPAAIHIVVKSAEATSGCGTLTASFGTCNVPNGTVPLTIGGMTLGRAYRLQYASAAQLTAGTWVDSILLNAVTASTVITVNAGSPQTRWARVMDVAQPSCVSNVAGPDPCAPAEVSPQWWCLSGTCVQALSQPSGSTGPYANSGACTAAPCAAPSAPVSIRWSSGFSPAPAPCIVNSVAPLVVGTYYSFNFIVTGVLPSAVTVTGIPAGMSRVNGSSSIAISGTPTAAGALNLVLSSGACSCSISGSISAGCVFNLTISPSVFVQNVNTSVTYTVTGPAGCFIRIGAYKNGLPITSDGITPIIVTLPVGNTYTTNLWGPEYVGQAVEWRMMPDQPSCAGASCTYLPAVYPLTITA